MRWIMQVSSYRFKSGKSLGSNHIQEGLHYGKRNDEKPIFPRIFPKYTGWVTWEEPRKFKYLNESSDLWMKQRAETGAMESKSKFIAQHDLESYLQLENRN